jgi:uncharacterized hydrophobic protein (TIGR00271 family)
VATFVRERIEKALRIKSNQKPRIYTQIYQSAEIASLNYWLEILFAAGIATLGLVLNSPAVVIGAMLISPLMGPILAAGLSLAAGDLYLGVRSFLVMLASVLVAVAFSAVMVWVLPFHSPTQEILNRTQPNLLDLGVAVFSGLAGSVVLCRGGGGGGVTALPGVAIAVALMPPLCTVGFGVGSGFLWSVISGAGLLFVTNLAAIIASAFFVFFVVRMDSPDVREEIDASIRLEAANDRIYALLEHTVLSRMLADVGKLRWRALMLVSVLAVLFFPLSKSLLQLRDEASARAAVGDAVRTIAPIDSVVSQTIDIGQERIRVRLILTESVPAKRIDQARGIILKRTGKDVDLFVRKVAGEEELAILRERLRTPVAPPPVENLASAGAELLPRLQQPLNQLWPEDLAQKTNYELGFNPTGVVVRIDYTASDMLHPAAAEILKKSLQSHLQVPDMNLQLNWIPPEPVKPPAKPSRRR